MIPEAFVGIAKLAIKDGVVNLSDRDPCVYERSFGAWRIELNGSNTAIEWKGRTIPPFSAIVEFNGWPAGLIDPGGGIIAAGEAANEGAFISAIEAELGHAIGSAQ